jgi:peptide/nickel transport system permease protein
VIQDAEANGALYLGHYYWVLEPSLLLMVTGLGFAMVGFALDRVFNPKLRQI